MNINSGNEADLMPYLYENGQVTLTIAKKIPISEAHKEKVRINGKVKKKYYISSARYRLITSSAVNLFRQKKYQVIFLTLTFPGKIEHKDANVCFSRYIDNLRTNYKLNGYVAVHEYTHKGNSHYHLLCDLPWVSISLLNRAWNYSFSDYLDGSPNSVRLPKGKNRGVVKNFARCIKYCCKYFAKGRKFFDGELKTYECRCNFISHNIVSKPKLIDREIFQRISEKFNVIAREYPYCTIYFIEGVLERYEQFEEILNNSP